MVTTPPNLIDQEPDEWLPHGWTVKVRFRDNGKRDKFYFSPSGEVFNSKVMVCRHLSLDPKTTGSSRKPDTPCLQTNSSNVSSNISTEASNVKTPKKTISPKQKSVAYSTPSEKSQEQGRGGDGDYLPEKVYFERVPADGLPPGWIKDIKIQNMHGKIRRDPFFTDPVSGYVFRSMKDTLRYIETGDPGRLAFKPKSPIAAETVKVVGNKRKLQLSDAPECKSNERASDAKNCTPASSRRTIRKSTLKGQHGAHSPKIVEEQRLPRRSSGRLSASKEKTEVQITEQSTTKNLANGEPPKAFSYETSSRRAQSTSIPDNNSTDMTSNLPSRTGVGNKRGYKSPLLMSYEESWLDPCIDFAVKTLSETPPYGKDLSVHDYIGQSQGDGSEFSGGKWNNTDSAPVNKGMSGNSNGQKSVGSDSGFNWVRGTDRSLFR